jgi:hypothetical protein
MQLLESTVLGLRSARLTLTSPNLSIKITLFPMVHIGEPSFFRSVYEDAFSHDVALVEGVGGPIARRITRSYRWISGSKRLDLAVQPKYPSQSLVRARIVRADLSEDEFACAWRKVPLWLRALTYAIVPVVGLRYRWFGSRETLAEGMSLDDLPSRQETLNWNPETAAISQAILNSRDDYLLEHLQEQLDHPAPGVKRLAVVYGAAHMRAVLHKLTKSWGYYADEASWLTVFPLTSSKDASYHQLS